MKQRMPSPYSEETYHNTLRRLNADKLITKSNRKSIADFDKDYGGLREGIPLSFGRRTKYINFLTIIARNIKKDFNKVTKEDIKMFILRLNDNKVKPVSDKNKKPFAEETKGDIKSALKTFFKWFKGEGTFFPPEVAWIKNRKPKLDPEALTDEQVEKMVVHATSIRDKFIIKTLCYDLGLRPNEAMNLRREDIIKHVKQDGDYCYKFNIRVSKTKPRTISAHLTTDVVNEFLKWYDSQSFKEEFLFDFRQVSYNKVVRVAGLRALGRSVNCTLMRHTSITKYATLGYSGSQLSYRYGHTFNSKSINHYLQRTGELDNEGGEKVEASINTQIKKENEELKRRMDMLKEQLDKMQKALDCLNRRLEENEL